jgi:hypothetical protein
MKKGNKIGFQHTKETREKMSKNARRSSKGKFGELNPCWKGDNICKQQKHRRLDLKYGKPQECEHCGTTDKNKVYHWAAKDHNNYTTNREDYMRLCINCHWKYDGRLKKN